MKRPTLRNMLFANLAKCRPRSILWVLCIGGIVVLFNSYINNLHSMALKAQSPKRDVASIHDNEQVQNQAASNVAVILPPGVKKYNTLHLAQGKTFTLIVTYARSGSSWLGDILGHAPSSYYTFEPFIGLVKEGYYFKENSVCFNNNTCRHARKHSETNTFVIQQLFYFFTCQFDKLDHGISLTKTMKDSRFRQSYTKCIRENKNTDRTKCKQLLRNVCLKTTNRILKVIRISMELVKVMMDLFPQLKVVHLIRDPRAVSASRLALTGTFKMARDTESQTIDMCKRVHNDLYVAQGLQQSHINRITEILYEDLVELTQKHADRIFEFANLQMTEDVRNWIHKSTHASEEEKSTEDKQKTGVFGTVRDDPVAMTNKWRESLRFIDVVFIDKVCASVYKKIGYLPMDTESDLRNLTVPSRVHLDYR